MTQKPPIEHIYDLADLSAAGAQVTVSAGDGQLSSLAQWLGVQSVEKFAGVVDLRKLAINRYRFEATLTCDLTQASVVSLEPVRAHIAQSFSRDLRVTHHSPRHSPKSEEVTLAAAEDESPEEIPSSRFDLVGPLLEELALALNPYPRAPEEVFAPPEDKEESLESPFAVLKQLRDKG